MIQTMYGVGNIVPGYTSMPAGKKKLVQPQFGEDETGDFTQANWEQYAGTAHNVIGDVPGTPLESGQNTAFLLVLSPEGLAFLKDPYHSFPELRPNKPLSKVAISVDGKSLQVSQAALRSLVLHLDGNRLAKALLRQQAI